MPPRLPPGVDHKLVDDRFPQLEFGPGGLVAHHAEDLGPPRRAGPQEARGPAEVWHPANVREVHIHDGGGHFGEEVETVEEPRHIVPALAEGLRPVTPTPRHLELPPTLGRGPPNVKGGILGADVTSPTRLLPAREQVPRLPLGVVSDEGLDAVELHQGLVGVVIESPGEPVRRLTRVERVPFQGGESEYDHAAPSVGPGRGGRKLQYGPRARRIFPAKVRSYGQPRRPGRLSESCPAVSALPRRLMRYSVVTARPDTGAARTDHLGGRDVRLGPAPRLAAEGLPSAESAAAYGLRRGLRARRGLSLGIGIAVAHR